MGLVQIEACMEEICRPVLAGVERQREATSLMQETLRTTRERLMLGDCEGPPIGELLARLIEGVGKVDQRARRILARLEATALDLPANIVMLLSEKHERLEGNAS